MHNSHDFNFSWVAIIIGIFISLLISIRGCAASPAITVSEYETEEEQQEAIQNSFSKFIQIERIADDTYLVYDKDTKAMYIMTNNYTYHNNRVYSFCPYYNNEGTIMYYTDYIKAH